MEQLISSMKETVQMIEDTTTLFYQQKNQEGFLALDAMLHSIVNTVGKIENYQALLDEKIFDSEIFSVVLTEAMKALEQKDMVLVSDIMIFEVITMFEECFNRL